MLKHLLPALLLLALQEPVFSQNSTKLPEASPINSNFFAAPATIAPAALQRKPGYSIRGTWSPLTNPHTYDAWSDSTRYTYDGAGNETSATVFKRNALNSTINPYSKWLKSYDKHNRLSEEVHYSWRETGQTFVAYSRTRYSYGTGGAADSVINTTLDAATAAWQNSHLRTNRYDASGELTEWLDHSWQAGQWVVSYGERYLRTSSGSGLLLEEVHQAYAFSTWNDYRKTVNTYVGNRLKEQVVYNSSNGSWVPSGLYADFAFGSTSGNSELDHTYTIYAWTNNAWTPSTRHTYYTYPDGTKKYIHESRTGPETWRQVITQLQRYNDSGQLLNSLYLDERTAWIRETTDTLSYATDGTLLESRYYLNQNYFPHASEYRRYGDFTVPGAPTASPLAKETFAVIYPNPTRGLLFLEPTGTTGKTVVVETLDARGRLLSRQELRGQEKLTVDLNPYPAGLFLIRVQLGSQVLTHRVLKR